MTKQMALDAVEGIRIVKSYRATAAGPEDLCVYRWTFSRCLSKLQGLRSVHPKPVYFGEIWQAELDQPCTGHGAKIHALKGRASVASANLPSGVA